MEPIENILKTAVDNQKRAWQAIEQSGVIRCWGKHRGQSQSGGVVENRAFNEASGY